MDVSETLVARDIKGLTHHVQKKDMAFRISVYGVILEANSVLLVPQWDGYDIPGGSIELGEATEDALRREVHEETGLTVKPDMSSILHVTHDFFVHPTDGKAYHYMLLYYPCELVGGSLSDANFQEDEKIYAKVAEWVPIASVRSLKFYNPVDSPRIIESANLMRGDLKLREGVP